MERFKRILIIIMFICLMVFLLTFPSCKEIQYVPVHTVDTVIVDNYIRDSIRTSDSVYVYRNQDTLYVYKEKVYYRDKLVTDTVYRNTVKEVPVEVTKTIEVEKHTPVKNAFAWIGFLASVVLLGYILYRFKKQ